MLPSACHACRAEDDPLTAYLLRRLLLMIPTIWGILTITFIVVQFVPGGPMDQIRDLLEGRGKVAGEAGGSTAAVATAGKERRSVSAEDFEKLRAVYHLDRPLYERYLRTFVWFSRGDRSVPLWRALSTWQNWDGMLLGKFGDSFYRNKNVLQLIREKLPVSLSLGIWSFVLSYPLCILLGIAKAVRDGTRFDLSTSGLILVGYSVPGFVLAVVLIVLLGPGDAAFCNAIPLSGLTSAGAAGYESWSWGQRLLDYLHHLVGPLICLNIGGFAVLTLLTKNAILEETGKQYVITARAKGLTRRRVLFGHVLRNAMIPLVTDFPTSFLAMFFTGSVLIEKIFNLDGMGLLAYTSVIQRDYPVVMGNLFIMTLIGLVGQLLTDISYTVVDPRISFARAES
jgi:microcin C transport system permease protein